MSQLGTHHLSTLLCAQQLSRPGEMALDQLAASAATFQGASLALVLGSLGNRVQTKQTVKCAAGARGRGRGNGQRGCWPRMIAAGRDHWKTLWASCEQRAG